MGHFGFSGLVGDKPHVDYLSMIRGRVVIFEEVKMMRGKVTSLATFPVFA